MAKALTWSMRCLLALLADKRDRRRRYVMAEEDRPDTRWRAYPGGKKWDRRVVTRLISYGFLQRVQDGPAGLPVYTITGQGREALEKNERPG